MAWSPELSSQALLTLSMLTTVLLFISSHVPYHVYLNIRATFMSSHLMFSSSNNGASSYLERYRRNIFTVYYSEIVLALDLCLLCGRLVDAMNRNHLTRLEDPTHRPSRRRTRQLKLIINQKIAGHFACNPTVSGHSQPTLLIVDKIGISL